MSTTEVSRRDEYDGSVTVTGRTAGGNTVQVQLSRQLAATEVAQRLLDEAGDRMDAQALALAAQAHQVQSE